MIKFIIGVILTIISLYFVITSMQDYFANQEEIKRLEQEVKEEDAFYKSYGCTYNAGRKMYTCPPNTPDWTPS